MKVKITVMRRSEYKDLSELYENAVADACGVSVGQTFTVAEGCGKPQGLCDSAWESMLPFVEELLRGGGSFYGGWMKNPRSAMISCNDGFRPVTFYIEAVD